MCKKCIRNSNCDCKCRGDDVKVTQEFEGRDLSVGMRGGSKTIAVCGECKHKIDLDDKSGCCLGMAFGPIGLLFDK